MRGVLVVGSANMDVTLPLGRLPRPGETLLADGASWGCGGKGANQAVAASRLGLQTAFAGAVGEDAFGGALRRALGDEGVDVTHLMTGDGAVTGLAVISRTPEGESTIVVAPGANGSLTAEWVNALPAALFRRAFVVVQLEIPVDAALAAMQRGTAEGAMVLLDPAPADGAAPLLLAAADVVTPNRHEASVLTGIEVMEAKDARRAGEKLLEQGARAAIVKLGAGGAVVVTPGEWAFVPPVPTRAIDETAAGDAFLAGLMLGLTEGKPLAAAAGVGARAGAAAASRPGAMASLPRREDLGRFDRA